MQSNHHIEAAKLLAQLAAEAAAARAPPLRMKKLHVLAALEVERFRRGLLDAGKLCCTYYISSADGQWQRLCSHIASSSSFVRCQWPDRKRAGLPCCRRQSQQGRRR